MIPAVVMVIFIIVPSMYLKNRSSVSYLVWVPILLGTARILWQQRERREVET